MLVAGLKPTSDYGALISHQQGIVEQQDAPDLVRVEGKIVSRREATADTVTLSGANCRCAVELPENAIFTVNVATVLTTNGLPTGLFTFEDYTSLTQVYYRLKSNP